MSRETSLQSLGQRQRLLEWNQRVADCRQSGMSVKRWCDENGEEGLSFREDIHSALASMSKSIRD